MRKILNDIQSNQTQTKDLIEFTQSNAFQPLSQISKSINFLILVVQTLLSTQFLNILFLWRLAHAEGK